MTSGNGQAVRLARRLRELREHQWSDVNLTQAQLAHALSAEGNVAHTTISSWESHSSPKAPPKARLKAYARFFATRKSLAGGPHLVPLDQLTEEERQRIKELEEELLSLYPGQQDHEPVEPRRALLFFEEIGPIVVICPEAPEDLRGPLADENHINHTKLHKYADLDALIEIFGHIRALNPERHVLHRITSDVQQAELQNHLVVLGGIGWNSTTRRILLQLKKLPIEQVDVAGLPGDVFRVKKDEDREEKTHFPVMEEREDQSGEELVEDLALLARLPNPFNFSRTLTICNGVHSSGVLGAVMILTDETLRPSNEAYLAQRFPDGEFAMLVKVPVVSGKVLAPDLQNPETRVFEWAPGSGSSGA